MKKNKLRVTSVFDKSISYKTKWIQHAIQMPRSRLLNLLTQYAPRGIKNQGTPLKRLLDDWDWNRQAMACFPESKVVVMKQKGESSRL
jgi:hypothetical protein